MKNIMIDAVENGFVVIEEQEERFLTKRKWAFETKETLSEFILDYYTDLVVVKEGDIKVGGLKL